MAGVRGAGGLAGTVIASEQVVALSAPLLAAAGIRIDDDEEL